MPGFRMDEIMVGALCPDDSQERRPMHLHLTWGHPDLTAYVNPLSPDFLRARARGHITAAGLVHKADCTGSLTLLYFSERKIRYELDFAGARGKIYHYRGEKVNIRPWNLHRTHTTCYGTITDSETGKVMSRSIIRFPLSELTTFLTSFRLVPTHDPGWEEFPGAMMAPAAPFDVLSAKERDILVALAGGLIPGGVGLTPGAGTLAPRWLPRSEFTLQRMPRPTRYAFKAMLHLLNHVLPLCFGKGRRPMVDLAEADRGRVLARMENAVFPCPLAIMLIKAVVLPAVYGLPEVKQALGYAERFANPAFERLKPEYDRPAHGEDPPC